MKEITAVIRMNMISKTKEALLKSDFPAFTCRQVVGRGKKKVAYTLVDEEALLNKMSEEKNLLEELSEYHRLVPKRMMTLLVNDEDVQSVIDLLIAVNRSGNPGDGKIFISPVEETIRVRTGETGEAAL